MKSNNLIIFFITITLIFFIIENFNNNNESKLNISINNNNQIKNNLYLKNNISLNNNSWYIPKQNIKWQYQLTNNLNLSYKVNLYDIDLEETSKKTINKLHKKKIKVICYLNAGAYETYRKDSNLFPKEVLGNKLKNWNNERWLDISNYKKFSKIILNRLNLAVKKGCDGIEPDNIDGYINNNGFNLSYESQIKYNKWLVKQAHKRNLSIALKNDLAQIKDLVNYFDFIINEQCLEYNECNYLKPFIKNNKAVLTVEYDNKYKNKNNFNKLCKKMNNLNFSTLFLPLNLDGKFRLSCKN